MKRLVLQQSQNWAKHLLLIFAFSLLAVLTYHGLSQLNRFSMDATHNEIQLAVTLSAFLIPISLSWMSYRSLSLILFLPCATSIAVLSTLVTRAPWFLIFAPAQVLFCLALFYVDQSKGAHIIDCHVEIEKAVNEKNDLETAYQEKGTSISVFFKKYTSYYNLRNLASDFSATLSLKELCQTIVSKTLGLVGTGSERSPVSCMLLLSESEGGNLSLIASKSLPTEKSIQSKSGDLFDFWILRNRQSLIVMDTQKDFRFDLKKTQELKELRSLISSPMIHEGKAIGTIRMQSPYASAFTTDNLRILDAISTLASSAISNSILFQKTEELAIKDSLTGLYVQRYFLERLSEEHRRSLMTGAALTLLMCDLDHFKACNDRYGHSIGDVILIKTADLFRAHAEHGVVARYGGEEFAMLFPRLVRQEGRSLAETIRRDLERMNVTVRREVIPMTISIGVASMPEDTLDSETLIQIADERLYKAKKGGRNRVCGD